MTAGETPAVALRPLLPQPQAAPGLTPLGAADAGLCVDGVCEIPGAAAGAESNGR